jgi:hypothetical protein
MSDETPTPAPTPAPAPVAAAPLPFQNGNPIHTPERLSRYIKAFEDKGHRMIASRRRAAIWLVAIFAVGIGAVSAIGELDQYFKLGYQFIVDTVQKNGLPPIIPVILALTIPAFILIQIIQAVPAVLVWWASSSRPHGAM